LNNLIVAEKLLPYVATWNLTKQYRFGEVHQSQLLAELSHTRKVGFDPKPSVSLIQSGRSTRYFCGCIANWICPDIAELIY
jgi:hypothetical protein